MLLIASAVEGHKAVKAKRVVNMKRALLIGVLALAGCGVPKDRPYAHAIYLRDAAGHCVALFAPISVGNQAAEARIQHGVKDSLCKSER